MPRKESPMWDKYCVNRVNAKSAGSFHWDCTFCGAHGSGTLTRLVAHLAGIAGEGIEKCVQVTLEAHQEAVAAAKESELTSKKKKRIREIESMEQQIELDEGMMGSMADTMFQPHASAASTGTSSLRHTIDQTPIDIQESEGSRRINLTQSTIKRGSSAAMLIKKELSFTIELSKSHAAKCKPVSWWERYGDNVPLLQSLACRVLSQDCSSGAAERNWNAHALAHTKRRNRLKVKQVERLVYIRENLRLVHSFQTHAGLPMQVNPDEIDIDKTPEMPPPAINIDTKVAQAYFEEAEAMHIGRITRSRSRAAAAVTDEAMESPSCSTIRGGRGRGRGRCRARVASARRVLTRRATAVASNIEDGNDDEGDEEDEDFDDAMVDSSSDCVDSYDDATTESSNDDAEEEEGPD